MIDGIEMGGFVVMPNEMNVVIESLRAHASKVDGVVEQLGTAVDASQQTSLSNDAYGILCQPFAMLIDPVEQQSVSALNEAVRAMTELADNIRSTAENYQATDDGNADIVGGVA